MDRMCIRGEKQNFVLLGADVLPAEAEAPDVEGVGDATEALAEVEGRDGVAGADDDAAPVESVANVLTIIVYLFKFFIQSFLTCGCDRCLEKVPAVLHNFKLKVCPGD